MSARLGLSAVIAALLSATTALAQEVPLHNVPVGKGPGVSGFGAVPPGTVGNCLTSNGPGADPSFQACSGATAGAMPNIINFGADPTGVADSTAGIQAAIDFAAAHNLQNVYCPDGNYTVSYPIFLDPPGNLRPTQATAIAWQANTFYSVGTPQVSTGTTTTNFVTDGGTWYYPVGGLYNYNFQPSLNPGIWHVMANWNSGTTYHGGYINGQFLQSGGTGYTPGTYNNLALTYVSHTVGTGAGTGATVNVIVGAGGNVTFTSMSPPAGTGYQPGDILTATIPGGSGFAFGVSSISGDIVLYKGIAFAQMVPTSTNVTPAMQQMQWACPGNLEPCTRILPPTWMPLTQAPPLFTFSLSFLGNGGLDGGISNHSGCYLNYTFNNWVGFVVGGGQGMQVRGVQVNTNASGNAALYWRDGVGIGIAGGSAGAHDTLIENTGANGWSTAYMTGFNQNSLGDSNTFSKVVANACYNGVVISQTQNDINRIDESIMSCTNSVVNPIGPQVIWTGGNSSQPGLPTGAQSIDPSLTSALTAVTNKINGNALTYTFTVKINVDEIFVGYVLDSWTIVTKNYGGIPLQQISFDPNNHVLGFRILDTWAYNASGTNNMLTTSDLQADIQAQSIIYGSQRHHIFTGDAFTVIGDHIENELTCTTLYDGRDGYSDFGSYFLRTRFNYDPGTLNSPNNVQNSTANITSMVWSNTSGGQVAVVLATNNLTGYSQVSTGTGMWFQGISSTGGTGPLTSVNTLVFPNTVTDNQHFTFLLPASVGQFGTMGVANAQVVSRGLGAYWCQRAWPMISITPNSQGTLEFKEVNWAIGTGQAGIEPVLIDYANLTQTGMTFSGGEPIGVNVRTLMAYGTSGGSIDGNLTAKYTAGAGAGEFDGSPFVTRFDINNNLWTARLGGAMGTHFRGFFPASETVQHLPSIWTTFTSGFQCNAGGAGCGNIIFPPGAGFIGTNYLGEDPVLNGGTSYQTVDWNSGVLPGNFLRSAHQFYSYGQNLTRSSIAHVSYPNPVMPALAWNIRAGSNVLYMDAESVKFMFAGLGIQLALSSGSCAPCVGTPANATYNFVVTGVYPTATLTGGYVTLQQASNNSLANGAGNGIDIGTTYTGTSIGQQPYVFTRSDWSATPSTFANLPTCGATQQGLKGLITNGPASPVFGASAAGGGSTVTPVTCNGASWING